MTPGPIVVDIQALQSPDFRGRGIARYAYELAVALDRDHPGLVGRFLLNPDLPPPGDLGPLLGPGKVEYAGAPGAIAQEARLLHVLSPFELAAPIDRVWPRWAHERGIRVCATVYDLIPLEHPHTYLDDVRQRARYMGRLEVLRAADALLTISPATSRSLVESLGIDPRRLHMVGAGTAGRFVPAASSEDACAQAQTSLPELESSFVLYPTGSDGRKNVETLVRAFALLPEELRSTRQLVLVGQLPELTANHFRHLAALEGIGNRVLVTGHVSEETMLRLYQATELLCFPSLVEGYGLPVAEAMACGAVAVVSDVDPLRDLVEPDARFDPHDPAAVSAAIERGLCDLAFREASRTHASAALTTWSDVANRTVAAYEAVLARPGRPWRPRRRRVAIVSPFPPVASGIANYSFRLVEELALRGELEIDCFADGLDRTPGPSTAPAGLTIYDARWLARIEAATAGYDDVVYVLGNSEFHAAALASLRRRKGIVLAHEVRLSGLYRFASDSTAAVPEGLSGSIRSIYGPLLPEGLGSSGEVTATEAERYGLLMAREVIALADRFLVTSEAAARLARIEAGPGLAQRIGVLPFATELLRSEGTPHASLPIEEGTRVLASFGIVDPIKQPHRLVRAFGALAADDAELVLALVGPVSIDLARELRGLAEELGVAKRLLVAGRVEAPVYRAWLDRAELAVQLRASFSGEASAAVGDCLAAGVPMIVTDVGWLGELPDDAAVKVAVDVSASELGQACGRLIADPVARSKLSSGARAYAEEHTFAAAARVLLEMLDTRAAAAG